MTKPEKQIINENPLLVDALERQHKELLVLFISVTEFAKKKNYQELNQTLQTFSNLIEEHIRTERELYMYLELVVSKSDGRYRDTRADMRGIALLIKSKLNLHINTAITDKTIKVFQKDFAILGKAMLGRIRFEEKHLFNDYTQHSL